MSVKNTKPIVIVGAGLAGISCALELEKQGHSTILLEKESAVGGRVRTEHYQGGYLLDHGFQVLIPSYSEIRRHIDLKELDLQYFHAGAIVKSENETFTISDPLSHPSKLIETLASPFANFSDKLLILKLRFQIQSRGDEFLLGSEHGSSLEFLRRFGFSEKIIHNFWRPFFSGVFLESHLQTPASFMLFIYKMFGRSAVAVPSQGIGELPRLLAGKLTRSALFLSTAVSEIAPHYVRLSNGKRIDTAATVMAGRADQSAAFLKLNTSPFHALRTYYYSAPEAPYQGPWLCLQTSSPQRRINHVALMSEVAKTYAPSGQTLVSVNLLGPIDATPSKQSLEQELTFLFGSQVRHWQYLKDFCLPYSLPAYPLRFSGKTKVDGVYVCGDYCESPSQQGALLSGRKTAMSILQDLKAL